MALVWRGLGIVVAGIIVLAGILAIFFVPGREVLRGEGYWALTFLIACPLLLLSWFLIYRKQKAGTFKNPDLNNSKHDFFFLPIWVWSIVALPIGLWFFSYTNSYSWGDPEEMTSEEQTEEETVTELSRRETQTISFFNAGSDSAAVNVYDDYSTPSWTMMVPYLNIRYGEYDARNYEIEADGKKTKIKVQGAVWDDNICYSDAWYLVGGAFDLVQLDATEICIPDIDAAAIETVNWKDKIMERYNGPYVEPIIERDTSRYTEVISPAFYLPKDAGKSRVITFVAVPKGMDPTEAFLDSAMVSVRLPE